MKPASRASSTPRSSGLGSASPVGAAGAAQASAGVAQVARVAAPGLDGIHFASTWPRGWMVAAAAQQVREFNLQTSRAQLALQFAADWGELLQQLQRLAQRQASLPSAAAQARSQAALDAVQALWAQRHGLTLGSLDERLHWSASQPARSYWRLGGWNAASLQAQAANDRELVAFCLLGQEHEHGSWQADAQRGSAASRFALACALAPLGLQLDQVSAEHIVISTDERRAALVRQRLMARGAGRRFPAGQWQMPLLAPGPQTVALPPHTLEDGLAALLQTLPLLRQRLAQLQAQLTQFLQEARASLEGRPPDALERFQTFTQQFAQAGGMPAYDWVLAVVPAVRALARNRVARLLHRPPLSD